MIPYASSTRLSLALATMLTLAACGGGGTDPAPAPATTPLPAPAPAPAPDPAPVPVPAPTPTPSPIPVVLTQPASATVADGATATFALTATGSGTLQYQWLRNGVPLPQASQASLPVKASASEDGAIYRAIVKGTGGETQSQAAALRLAGSKRPDIIGAIGPLPAVPFVGTPMATRGFVDGSAPDARFNLLASVSSDMAGNLYVADLRNHAVRKVSPSGVVSTLASIEPRSYEYSSEKTLTVSAAMDGGAYAIGAQAWRIDGNGNKTLLAVPTLAGDWVEEGLPVRAHSSRIADIVADRLGNRYEMIEEFAIHMCPGFNGCPDYIRSTVRKVGADGAVRVTGAPAMPGRSTSSLNWRPLAMVADAAGNLYVSDIASDSIWKLGVDGAWSLLGNVKHSFAHALAVDTQGNVYALNATSSGLTESIRKIAPDGKVTMLERPVGQPLYQYEYGRAPTMTVDADNNIWVTQGNALVRFVQP